MKGEIVACLGGWCVHRTHCAHYYSDSPIRSERLCPKGESQPVEVMPLVRDEQLPAALRGEALRVF